VGEGFRRSGYRLILLEKGGEVTQKICVRGSWQRFIGVRKVLTGKGGGIRVFVLEGFKREEDVKNFGDPPGVGGGGGGVGVCGGLCRGGGGWCVAMVNLCFMFGCFGGDLLCGVGTRFVFVLVGGGFWGWCKKKK